MANLEYNRVVREILMNGTVRDDRTGVGTKSIFGVNMKFDLAQSFPLLTSKRVFFRGVVEELLWFFRGSTNAGELSERGIHIWDGHSSRQFLDSMGFYDRDTGEVGPMYGFQWRRWGEKYGAESPNSRSHSNTPMSSSTGIDQLTDLIRNLRTDPFSRRHILSAWNVSDIPLMSLAPCHILAQFYVYKHCDTHFLDCQVYQRSADFALGIPFNIASYALLIHVLAHILGYTPGKLHYTIGDAHIYSNHITSITEQIERTPRSAPTLRIKCAPKNMPENYSVEDFEVLNYNPHAPVKFAVAI